MTADCNDIKTTKQNLKDQLDRMMKGVKELEAYEHVIEEIKRLENEIAQKETNQQKQEQFKSQMEKMMEEVNKMDKYEQIKNSQKRIEEIIKEMDIMDEKKIFKEQSKKIMSLIDEMENTPTVLKDIQQNGLQSTISSGLQAPGTFTPQKGLFQ